MRDRPILVTPAKTGVQLQRDAGKLDPRLRGDDEDRMVSAAYFPFSQALTSPLIRGRLTLRSLRVAIVLS